MSDTKKIAVIAAAAIYASGALFTFGLMHNRIECGKGDIAEIMCAEQKVWGALGSAMFWPLTASVILQEPRP